MRDLKPRLIDQQGRVALPPEIMRQLDVKRGDYVVFVVEGEAVHVRRVEWTVK